MNTNTEQVKSETSEIVMTNLEIPSTRRANKLPFAELLARKNEENACFIVMNTKVSRVNSLINYHSKKKLGGAKFQARTLGDGKVGVWNKIDSSCAPMVIKSQAKPMISKKAKMITKLTTVNK